MAGIGTAPGAAQATPVRLTSGQLFATIAWLRWRIFVNMLRGKGAVGELVVKILSYPLLALMILAPSGFAGFGAWYFVSNGMDAYLAIPLWLIFVLWQFIGVSTSTTGPSFDLNSLVRFPIRYRDYLLMRLSFGLMDPPTLAGIGCLISMSIGIGIASPSLFPWAALLLLVYAACNLLFSRMIYSWLERWLAQRRTREMITVLILFVSLGIQVASQFIQRFTRGGHHTALSPSMEKAAHILLAVNWLLPPGLTASSIEHMHRGAALAGVGAFGGLAAFTALFLLILNVRMRAQYMGEDLSEAPAARSVKKKTQIRTGTASGPVTERESGRGTGFLPAAVQACLIKEIRYLLRSGPKLYVLVMPLFIVFLFSARSSGIEYAGFSRGSMKGIIFAYGCAYMQLIFVAMMYNALGSDGAGVQFYFMAPLRMRDVMLGKNLMTGGIMLIEVVLIYIMSALLSSPPAADLAAATVAWSLFALFVNMSIGNVRSITSPKVILAAKVRSQNVSGMSSFISLLVIAVAIGLGSLMLLLCRVLAASYWVAAAVFLVLAGLAFGVYLLVMRRIDGIAARNVEDLTRELSKA